MANTHAHRPWGTRFVCMSCDEGIEDCNCPRTGIKLYDLVTERQVTWAEIAKSFYRSYGEKSWMAYCTRIKAKRKTPTIDEWDYLFEPEPEPEYCTKSFVHDEPIEMINGRCFECEKNWAWSDDYFSDWDDYDYGWDDDYERENTLLGVVHVLRDRGLTGLKLDEAVKQAASFL